jgi:hypothetical protein
MEFPTPDVEFCRFLQRENKNETNTIVYGGAHGYTQSKKTEHTSRFVRLSLDQGFHVLVSCTKYKVHVQQMYQRLSTSLQHFKHNLLYEIFLLDASKEKVLKKKVQKAFREKKQCVFLSMETSASLKLFTEILMSDIELNMQTPLKSLPRKFVFFHDEGDIITHTEPLIKNEDLDKNRDEIHNNPQVTVQVQDQWEKLVRYLSSKVELRRFFITATIENPLFYFPIAYPISLPVPKEYVGWKDVLHTNFSGKEKDVYDIIEREYQRIVHHEKDQGIVLCMTENQKKQHMKLLYGLVERFYPLDPLNQNNTKNKENIIICVHNGDGILAYLPPFHQPFFPTEWKEEEKKSKNGGGVENLFYIKKEYPIATFYEWCRQQKIKMVVTIGYHLMNRGITHVSDGPRNQKPLATISQLLCPGPSMSAVNIIQMIGRLLGCARPGIRPRLFTPMDVWKTFTGYMHNQEEMMKVMRHSENTMVSMRQHSWEKKIPRLLERSSLTSIKTIKCKKNSKIEKIEKIEKMEKSSFLNEERLREYWKRMQRLESRENTSEISLDNISETWPLKILYILWKKEYRTDGISQRELGKLIRYRDYSSSNNSFVEEETKKSFESTLRNGAKGGQESKALGTFLWKLFPKEERILLNPELVPFFNKCE